MSDEQISLDEKYLASAVHYLLAKGQFDVARFLLSCELLSAYHPVNNTGMVLKILLRGSTDFYDKYMNDVTYELYRDYEREVEIDGAFRSAIRSAMEAVLGTQTFHLSVAVGLVNVDLDWRTRLLAESETYEQVSNQNPYRKDSEAKIWMGMKFDSEGEIKIAQVLEKLGVMYFPTSLARVGAAGEREARIPDFLICYRGKWGILEVDGKTFHTPANATQDHDRRRKFLQHGGIAHFDRFVYSRCMTEPDKVIAEFLSILGR